jgi:hypothetical protein
VSVDMLEGVFDGEHRVGGFAVASGWACGRVVGQCGSVARICACDGDLVAVGVVVGVGVGVIVGAAV